MQTRLVLKTQRFIEKKNGNYFEGHHIIPKYLGGTGNSNRPLNNNNIVLLTPREHFIAHLLLWRENRDRQSALALHKMMSNNKNQNRTSNRGYEEARLAFRITNIGNKYGQNQKGKKISQEQKDLQSQKMKGRYNGEKNPFYGKTHTEESKQKIKENRKHIKFEDTWNYKGVRVIIKNDEIIAKFHTNKEVADFLKCSESNVRHGLGGSQKTVKGYILKYE
jgi:DNA-binding CsgD family transcriptional regulator